MSWGEKKRQQNNKERRWGCERQKEVENCCLFSGKMSGRVVPDPALVQTFSCVFHMCFFLIQFLELKNIFTCDWKGTEGGFLKEAEWELVITSGE